MLIQPHWGPIRRTEPFAPGVDIVRCERHGGLRIAPEKARDLPAVLRKFGIETADGYLWWEEDCAAQVAVLVWPAEYQLRYGEEAVDRAIASFMADFPEIYEDLQRSGFLSPATASMAL